MNSSAILRAAARTLAPMLILVSLALLARGHQEPGGGFVGGLVAASAVLMYALAFGVREARAQLRLPPLRISGFGVLIGLISALLGLFGGAFFQALWLPAKVPAVGKLGTPLLFDMGVYLVVLGVGAAIVLELLEED